MARDLDRVLERLDKLDANRRSVFTGIYLTLFSVAGGVALGLIANSLSREIPHFTSLWALQGEQWIAILLSFCTVLVLGAVLSGYVLTVSYYYWEPTEADIVHPLLLGLSVCMAAAYVTDPPMWLLWLFGVAMAGGLSYLRSEWVVEYGKVFILEELSEVEGLGPEVADVKRRRLVQLRRNKWLSFGIGVVGLAWGISRGWYRSPSRATLDDVLVVTGLVVVACAILAVRYNRAFTEASACLGSAVRDRLPGPTARRPADPEPQ